MQTTKIWLPGLVLFCLLCGLLSCRKENLNGIHSMTDSSAIFSATVNGAPWQTDSVSAFLVGDYRGHSKVMTITGYTSQRVISISLQDTTTSGNDSTLSVQEYPLRNWGNAAAFAYGNNRVLYGRSLVWQTEGSAFSGQAAVTSSDGENKLVAGTFAFTAKVLTIDTSGLVVDSVTVTNGVFKNIPYSFLRHP